MNETNEMNYIIDLLEKKDASSYQAAIKYISHTMQELKDMKFAFDQASVMAITDAEGVFTYVNDQFCDISQYKRHELIGNTHRMLNSGHHDDAFFRRLWETIVSGEVWKGQIQNKAKDGSFYWLKTTIVPFVDADGLPEKYIAIRTDISSHKETESKIYKMEHIDELTGLANGRLFNQTLDKYVVQPKDKMDHLAVVYVNIDRLSLINDTLGYAAGDEILIELGRRLLAWHLVHPYTFVSRFGSDEFALLIVNQDPDRFNTLLQEIQDQFNLPFVTDDNEIFLSGRMGVAMYPRDGTTTNELIQHADIAKNQAKK